MKPHALLAALLTHALTHAAPSPVRYPDRYLPAIDAYDYDYSADVEAQEAMLVQATTTPPEDLEPRDPLEDGTPTLSALTPPPDCTKISAREMAKLNIMDRILIALGPPFGEKLPKAPTRDTFATVPTPINITTEPCPYKYKRCSSQTYFPSCDIPRNTAPEIWPQRFNLYFNLSADFYSKLDVINATLRLYKNNSLPLQRPKILLIKAFVYTRSLTKRRSEYKTKLVADTQISSDYLGWVTLSVTEIVKRWKKHKNNHGVLITVNDVDDIPWDAPRIFVTMDCASSLVPLPFEVQTEQEGQQYPALNVRLGSPKDEPDATVSSSPPPPPSLSTPSVYLSTLPPPSPTMQGDDPERYEYNYEDDLEAEEDKEREVEGLPVEDVEVQSGDEGVIRVEEEPSRPFRPYALYRRSHHQERARDSTPTTHHQHHHHLAHQHHEQGPTPPPPPPPSLHHHPTHASQQQYPAALNARFGSPEDAVNATASSSSSLHPPLATLPPPSPTMQGDDPERFEYNYEADLEAEEDKEREVEGLPVEHVEVQSGDEGVVRVEEEPARPSRSFGQYSRAHHRGLQERRDRSSSSPHHHHHHHQHHHDDQEPTTPPPSMHHLLTHATPFPQPQDTPATPPQPTPPVAAPRVAQGRRGSPKHRRKNRGGHRRL